MNSIAESKKVQDFDEEDLKIIKEQLAKVSRTSSHVMELCGQLVDIFKTGAEQVVKESSLNFFAI